jgi:hypothetical protein
VAFADDRLLSHDHLVITLGPQGTGLGVPSSIRLRAHEVIEKAGECPLLAQSVTGHSLLLAQSRHDSALSSCPLSGVKQT